MSLKVVLSPFESINAFVEQFNKLLTDADSGEFVRVLDMKGMAIPLVEFSREGYKIRKVFG